MTDSIRLDALGERLFDLSEPVPGAAGDPAGASVLRRCELAARHDLAIVAGLAERDPLAVGLLYDSVVLIGRRGQVCGRYRKSHLYGRQSCRCRGRHRVLRSEPGGRPTWRGAGHRAAGDRWRDLR